MFKKCEICKKGFHTEGPMRHTCGRAECISRYMWLHDIDPNRERKVKKLRNATETHKNIVNAVASAREVGMSYGYYMAFKERGWPIKPKNKEVF